METKLIRNKIEQLQNLLISVKYKRGFYAKVTWGGYYTFIIKLVIRVECAYKRDGTIVEIISHREYADFELDNILLYFNTWIRRQILKMEEHETDEWLLINDERVFDPHKTEIQSNGNKGK